MLKFLARAQDVLFTKTNNLGTNKEMFIHLSHDIESGYQKFDSNVSYCYTASLCQAASLSVYMSLYVVLWCFVIDTLWRSVLGAF